MGIIEHIEDLASRIDGWTNPFTGLGGARDRTHHTHFDPAVPIPKEELAALYHGDDIAARIVDTLPHAMTRLGWRVFSTADGPFDTMKESQLFSLSAAHPPTTPPTKIELELERCQLRHHLNEAIQWGRCYGGAVVYPGIRNGSPEDTPIDDNGTIGRISDSWQVFDARFALPYNGRYDPNVGVQVYRLMNCATGAVHDVHASRLLITRGAPTGHREQLSLQGWDYSVLQKAYEPLRQFNQAYKAAELLITDASQGVFKMKGLLRMIARDKKELETRATLIDMSRSVARSIFVDAEGEDFTKVASSFAGIPDTMDRFANRLAAASEIPVTLLMGQAPAGLNATGESDIRLWYDVVRGAQMRTLRPLIIRAANLVGRARGTQGPFEVRFMSLWQETPRQSSEREELESRSDDRRIKGGVLTPGEIRAMRYGLEAAGAPGIAQAQAFGAGGNIGGDPQPAPNAATGQIP